MTNDEVKSLEEFIKQQIDQEVVNRLDVFGREIIFLLNKINCYLPYLATPATIGLLEKDKDQILAFINKRTDETLDIIRDRLSMLNDAPIIHDENHENETVLSPEEREELQNEVNNSYIVEEQLKSGDPNLSFLDQYNNQILIKGK